MLYRAVLLTAGLLLCLLTTHTQAANATPGVLRISAIPDESPTQLQRRFEPLGNYLEAELGMPVQFVPVSDYAAVVEALAAKRVDLAWLGGFTFVQARLRTGDAVPLVQRERDQVFISRFISADPEVQSLQDLAGKTFAFGSVSSTSGHLMPRYFMMQESIEPEAFFSRIAFSGAHDATAAWVESGRVAGGVLNAAVWDRLVADGRVDSSRVRVFATTPTYYDYNWTARGSLSPQLRQRITAAFLALDPAKPEQRAILDLQSAKRFIPTRVENYTGIETAARAAGLLQ